MFKSMCGPASLSRFPECHEFRLLDHYARPTVRIHFSRTAPSMRRRQLGRRARRSSTDLFA